MGTAIVGRAGRAKLGGHGLRPSRRPDPARVAAAEAQRRRPERSDDLRRSRSCGDRLPRRAHGHRVLRASARSPRRQAQRRWRWPSPAYSYSAQVAEVSVDEETGEVTVHKVWAAHDCGRALNPVSVEGQIIGSVWMGMGQALTEEMVWKDGMLMNPGLLEYRSPSSVESPEVEPIIVESIDPEGPFGAKECSEGSLAATIPAIANAIYDAVGVRLHESPFTPERVLAALRAKRNAKAHEPDRRCRSNFANSLPRTRRIALVQRQGTGTSSAGSVAARAPLRRCGLSLAAIQAAAPSVGSRSHRAPRNACWQRARARRRYRHNPLHAAEAVRAGICGRPARNR